MSNFSRGLLAATLTSSLAFAGATTASAEETSNPCGSPKAEFTATVDGKEHTFKKVSEFLWQAIDDEEVELNRAEIFELAWEGADVCNSEPIDIDDETDGNTGGDDDADNGDDESDDNTGGDDEDSENGDGDESEGGDDDAENGGDDESDGNTGGDDDADNDDESEGGDDDADNDDESEGDGGDDADNGDDEDSENGDDDESEGDKDKNKDKSSFDGIKDALSSKDGKPTDLGIAAIVIGVLGALAAIVPNAARALGIKLPF
ncbi:hypothetical protein [Corynebacterium sp. HMSC072A04]|uniref:hypothetical protein n=1 Tax=Corynebacterium sp. HMSC072A04 TaxID=1715045 RepID=UPI0008BE93B7|nr:hypothetical protein [Corynebacterium sp. HMSC072A04]OFN34312.1 hypothetical protein HMPREF2565_10270 [Corynebacterium sp. HMSC072A04]